MARLLPVNAARCPQCGTKATRRLGFSPTQKGSIWRCCAEACGRVFVVPLLALQKRPA